MAKQAPSDASAPKETEGLTEVRIAHIMGLFRSMRYKRGATPKRLAREWGLGLQRVYELQSQATQRIRKEIADPDYVTTKVCVALDKVIDDSMREAKGAQIKGRDSDGGEVFLDYDPSKPRANVIQAGKVWAQLSGAMAPRKLEVSAGGGLHLDLPEDDPIRCAEILEAMAAVYRERAGR